MSVKTVKIPNEVLFLTEDKDLLARQLAGEKLAHDPSRKLIDNISTDEITPGWVCYWYDETLGHYSLVGLRGGVVKKDALMNRSPAVVVSGLSKGCGSSRETAPYSELVAGVKLVVAKTIEKIYGQNCQNIGLLTSTDFGLIERIGRGEAIPLSEFTQGLDPVATDIVRMGGLFNYNRARLAGEVKPPPQKTLARPMTLVEKIIARKTIINAATGEMGAPAVKPGDAVFVRADVRFSHDYTTAMAQAAFKQALGSDAKVTDPASIYAFRDHLTFLSQVMSDKHKQMGLGPVADNLAVIQRQFCQEQGIRLYDEKADGSGSEAICHNAVLEDIALPGDIVVGTDSHTCTAGAIGTFAFGVGSTDMANTWLTKDIRVSVPESVRFHVTGTLRPGVAAKDIMLRIMATPFIKDGKAIGKVLEFTGPGVEALSMDERATLTNMAVEVALRQRDVEFVRAKVGDRYVLEELAARGWQLGGEGSGHLLALDRHTTGDGIVSALLVLQSVCRSGRSLAEQLQGVDLFPLPGVSPNGYFPDYSTNYYPGINRGNVRTRQLALINSAVTSGAPAPTIVVYNEEMSDFKPPKKDVHGNPITKANPYVPGRDPVDVSQQSIVNALIGAAQKALQT